MVGKWFGVPKTTPWCDYADHIGLGNAESCEKDLEMYEFYQKRYKEINTPIKKQMEELKIDSTKKRTTTGRTRF